MKLWLIWFVFSLMGAALCQILVDLHLPWLGYFTPDFARAQLLNKFGMLIPFEGIPHVRALLAALDAHPQAVFGFFILGGLGTLAFRGRCHDRFLASFNDDVLTRISDQSRPDKDSAAVLQFVELRWTIPPAGPRHETWQALQAWCEDHAEAVGRRGGSRAPLSMGVLTGRSGSGKSRMAYELARHLAGWDRTKEVSPLAAGLRSVGVYLRHALPGLRRRRDDPWGVALLIPPAGTTPKHFSKILAGWWPRRPTMLLLDDPLPQRTNALWEALHEAHAQRAFRHAVCLLVTNQTVPADSGLQYDPLSGCWSQEEVPAVPQPFCLAAESWFMPQETVEIAFATGRILGKSIAVERDVREHLYRITEGNPLLVELAVEWIAERDGASCRLEGLTAEALTLARAKRILDALKHREVIDSSKLAALALSTLIGGGAEEQIYRELKGSFEVLKTLPSYPELKACFPTDPLLPGYAMVIPPIRPDLVGDAFIDCVLPTIGPDRAKSLAEAGFRMKPAYMLRNLRRARPESSAMTRALREIDPAAIPGADPVELALGFADVAAICQPADRPLSTAESRAASCASALALISKLSPADRHRFCEGFARLCDIPAGQRQDRQLRVEIVMQIMLEAAREAEVVPPAHWIALFTVLDGRAIGSLRGTEDLVRSAEAVADEAQADALAEAAWLMGADWRADLAPLFRALSDNAARTGQAVRASRFAAMAESARPEQAREAAAAAASVASRFPDDPGVQLEAARARKYEAHARGQVSAGASALQARAAAESVAAVAVRFEDEPLFQAEACEAYRYEALAWAQVPGGASAREARAAADAAASIASRFPDDAPVNREAAEARKCETYAWCQVPNGAGVSEARAAADTAAAIASRFPGDVRINREAAQARRFEGYAWSEVRNGAGVSEARTAADTVAAIASRFPDDVPINRVATDARRFEAYAWGQVPNGAGVSEARAAADTAAAIASRFPDDAPINREAAKARRFEGYAWGQVRNGAGVSEARTAADTVAAIASRFPDDAPTNREAAEARKYEAYARSREPNGTGASEARAAADATAAIASRFPDDAPNNKEAAEARRHEAYAWSQRSGGSRASGARTAADTVAAIASRFPDNAPINREAAVARRHEAYAWCQVPNGAGASEARAAINAVLAIAAQFPHDAVIQDQAREARQLLAEIET
ncbi:hypothetical protein AcidC75_30830 [Acidisoma sp. C75]